MLKALSEMPKRERQSITLEINGANLDFQSDQFKAKIQTSSRALEREGIVVWRGPYKRNELAARMASIDWVVVPSIWWENSPMVIQEAFVYGRPVLASNIGGMAEKVKDGINGFTVKVGDSADWQKALSRAAGDPSLWNKLRDRIMRPITYAKAPLHICS